MSELRELLGRACRVSDTFSAPPKYEDITEAFYDECSKLSLGEVVFMQGFRLNDAMSAVELMDPKMDIGIVRYERKVDVETLHASGYFEKLTDRDLLTVIDATMCCLVSYLEGGNIANTVYTNVLMVNPDMVPHSTLGCLAHAFAHLVPMLRNIITTAMVFEEEDFNATIPYYVISKHSYAELLHLMKSAEDELNKRAETVKDNRYVLLASSSRIGWLRVLMEILTALVPPAPSRSDDDESPDPENKSFKPNLRLASELADRLTLLASTFVESSKLGVAAPDVNGDSKFEWLEVFEPEYNKLHLTGSFPRKTIIPPRESAMLFLYRLSCRFHRIATQCSSHVSDYGSFIGFFKDFGLDGSCVLSRSILQLTMLPHNEIVLGEIPLGNLVELTIKNTIRPMVGFEGSPPNEDSDCQLLYGDFIEEFTKASLSLVANFGMNLARQREKIGVCIEEINNTQQLSDQLDRRSIALMNGMCPEGHPMHPIMGFIFNQLVNLISYHLELSVRLELFAPHEYASVYWYLGEIMSRWHINTLERLQEIYIYEFKEMMNLTAGKANKKKTARRSKTEENLRARVDYGQAQMIRRYGESGLAMGISLTTIALIENGMIPVPKWDDNSDRMRFEHRMAPYRCLGPPLHLTYDQYLNVSKLNVLRKKEPSALLQDAFESFETAKTHFTKLAEREDSAVLAQDYLKICKTNAVTVKLLASGKLNSRKPEWSFLNETIIYPILKLT